MPKRPLDGIDCRILAALQEDGRMSNLDLSDKVGLSPSPCSRRVHLLETEGFVRRYVALLDPATIDLPVHVFVNIILEKQVEARAVCDQTESSGRQSGQPERRLSIEKTEFFQHKKI